MKLIIAITLALLATTAYTQTFSDCECDENLFMHKGFHDERCLPYPTVGDEDHIPGCVEYTYNQGVSCTQCENTHYLDVTLNVGICRPHGIAHCKTSSLKIGGMTWPDLEYKCLICEDTHYLFDEDTCTVNPNDID